MLNLPKCTCSICGKVLTVTGRQEQSTEEQTSGSVPRFILSAEPCACGHPDSVPCYDFGVVGEIE
jgi:hypothetical protein